MIPDHLVAEVRGRADIVETVAEHVSLRRAGKEYKGLCPFHQEKTPSFFVVPAKGMYKCFGCGEAGDVFSFLMKRQGLSFNEAVRHVADRVGVEIRETSSDRAPDEVHRLLYEAMAFAADFFRRQLWEQPGGEPARRYLEQRGVTREAAERFGLGYAPDEWHALGEAAHRYGFSDAVLLEAGLIKENERGREPYDRLRGRLIFPIPDLAGRIIAFGGRLIGVAREGAPKYLNSPETPLYSKGRILYGLFWSKTAIRREEAALVVEGYMDYVSLAAAGLENVVAPLGTALTDEQAALLARYTRRALLLYDSDLAGLRATFRSGDALLRAGVHPLVVTLPAGEDPDSMVRARGAAGLRPLLDAAKDVLERKLEILDQRGFFGDIEGVRKAVDGLLPTLRAAADPTLRDIYVARVAERTGVRRETLEQERDNRVAAGAPLPLPALRRPPEPPPARPTRRNPGERLLILLLLKDAERIASASKAVGADDLEDAVYRELFKALTTMLPAAAPARIPTGASDGSTALDAASQETEPAVRPALLQDSVLESLSREAREELEALRRDPTELNDSDRILAERIGEIRVRALFRRLDELDERMDRAPAEEQQELLGERTAIKRELQSLGSELARLGFKISRRYRRRGNSGRTPLAPGSRPSPEKG